MITPECTASIITLHPRQTFIADLFEILERERESGRKRVREKGERGRDRWVGRESGARRWGEGGENN